MYSTYRDQRADKYVLKYTYFDIRGRGEAVRYILALAKRKYEDIRIPSGSGKWPQIKAQTPFGQLPMLEADGHKIGSSVAIGRMVAKICDLAGSNFLNQALVDAIVDTCIDLREIIIKGAMASRGGQQQDSENPFEAMKETAKPVLEHLQTQLGDHDFFVENQVSFADLQFFASAEIAILSSNQVDFLDNFPKLKNLYRRIESLPEIKKYRRERKQTQF